MNTGIKQTLLIGLIGISTLACNQETEKEHTLSDKKPVVETIQIQEAKLSRKAMLPGELKPWDRVNVMARVKGYVGQVLVDRGNIVKKGQTLATLEAPEVLAELNTVKGRLAAAEAHVIETDSRLNASHHMYERMLETSHTKGAVSVNEMDLSYSKMMADSALAISARGTLDAAKAQLVSQRQLVKYLAVKAPFDGIIIERNISPGALVGPSDDKMIPMFVMENQAKLRLTVAVPENMVNAISEDSQVTFTVTASPGQEFTAKYARSSNSLQEMNRSMLTEFDVSNQDGTLKAGMYAEVLIPISRTKIAPVVPNSALINTPEGVFVIRVKDSKADWVSVKKGNHIHAQVEIFGDIKIGDEIVLLADPEIRNGQEL